MLSFQLQNFTDEKKLTEKGGKKIASWFNKRFYHVDYNCMKSFYNCK